MFDFELSLPPVPEAPGTARRALEGLRPEVGDATVDQAALLLSELVTNSVRHAASPDSSGEILVRVEVTEERLRAEVVNGGSGFDPEEVRRRPPRERGWGLALMDGIADRWAVERGNVNTTVWFELRRGAAGMSAGPSVARTV